MTVSNVESAVIRIGDGVAVDFDFDIEAIDAASIQVGYIIGITVVLADPADYSVAMNIGLTGGTVTFLAAPALSTKIYIFRATNLTQVVSVSRQQSYNPAVVERVWDKLTLIVQELSTAVKRAVKTGPDADPDTLVSDLEAARLEAVNAAAASVIAQDAAIQAAVDAEAFAASINPSLFALKASTSIISANWTITGAFNFGPADETTIAYDAGLKIDADSLTLRSKTGLKAMLTGVVDAAVALFYNGAQKLITTATGITVTGAVSADTVAGNWIATNAEAIAQTGLSSTKVMTPERGLEQIIANSLRQRATNTVSAGATVLITDIPVGRSFKISFTDLMNSLGTAQSLRLRCSTDGGSTWLSSHIGISPSAVWNVNAVSGELNFIPKNSCFGYFSGIRGGAGSVVFLPNSVWVIGGNNVVTPLVNAIELSWSSGNFQANGNYRVFEE